MSSSNPALYSYTTEERLTSLSHTRNKEPKKVLDLRRTRELLRSRFNMHRSQSTATVAAGLLRKEPTDHASSDEGPLVRLPRLQTPGQLSPTKLTNLIAEAVERRPAQSSKRLYIEAKYSVKARPKNRFVGSTTSATTLIPMSHTRRLSEGTRSELANAVTRCGYKTRTGSQMSGPKRNNQDSFMIVPNLSDVNGQYAFGVFDGHGTYGHLVSNLVTERLPHLLAGQLRTASSSKSIEQGLERSFLQVQQDLIVSPIDCSLSGSTACLVLIRGDIVYTANIGDSRAVIGQKDKGSWKNRPLTRDHKPDWPDESKRIIQAGGRVKPYYDQHGNALGPHRVWLPDKDMPGLAMSRSFGDLVAAKVGISAVPELRRYNLTPDDKFIVIASDGLWEFMSNQEVVDLVAVDYLSASAESSCDKLVREAVRRWNQNESVVDDITVVIVYLSVPSRY